MYIKLSPVVPLVYGEPMEVSVRGDVITINGEDFDFSPMPEGSTLLKDGIRSELIVGDVDRVNGQIELTLMLELGRYASEAARFPVPILVTEDGPVELPGDDPALIPQEPIVNTPDPEPPTEEPPTEVQPNE